MNLWVRVGEFGALESFDTIGEAAEYLNTLGVGKPIRWHSAGFETANYHGDDYIVFYWGDDNQEACRIMALCERMYLEDLLEDTQL